MMSATSIDPQTSKGQDASKAFPVSVQNGSLHQKDTVHDSDFEPYLTGQSNQNNSYQSMTDPYLSSYYAPSIGFPYPLSEAPWSTGGDPPIPYLTPYAPLSNGDHHFMHDTVFGQPGGLGSSIYPQHRFNFFPENPAFSAWGAPPPPQPPTAPHGSQSQQQGQQQQQQQTQQSSVSQAYGGSYSYPPSSLGGTLVQPGDVNSGQATTGGFHGAGDQSKAPGMNHHHHQQQQQQHHHSLEQGMLGLKLGGVVGGAGDMVGVGGSGLKVGSVIGGGGVGNNVVAVGGGGGGGMGTPIGMPLQNKPASWAAIASKPAKLTPGVGNNNNNGGGGNNSNKSKSNNNNNKPGVIMGGGGMMPPGGGGGGVAGGLPPLPGGGQQQPPIKHNMEIGTWDNKGGSVGGGGGAKVQAPPTLPPHPHHHHQQQQQHHHHHHQLHMAAPPPQSLVQQMSMQAPPPPHHSQQQQTYQNHSSMHPPPPQTRWVAPRNRNPGYGGGGGGLDGSAMAGGGVGNGGGGPLGAGPGLDPSHPVLEKLRANHSYNPKEFEWNLKNGRVFIIKSYSEDDIHRSIKYSIWCSTEHGNKRLDQAFRSLAAKGPVYLLFSVNGSGHFCGVAEMRSPVDYGASAGVWAQDKWKGKFDVAWLFVKDVPNSQLRHIRLENNDNKPVTNSRDTQEVPLEKAKLVLKIIAAYKHTTSIFDDFSHYEKKQEEEEVVRKTYEPAPIQSRSRLDQDRQNRSKQ